MTEFSGIDVFNCVPFSPLKRQNEARNTDERLKGDIASSAMNSCFVNDPKHCQEGGGRI